LKQFACCVKIFSFSFLIIREIVFKKLINLDFLFEKKIGNLFILLDYTLFNLIGETSAIYTYYIKYDYLLIDFTRNYKKLFFLGPKIKCGNKKQKHKTHLKTFENLILSFRQCFFFP